MTDKQLQKQIQDALDWEPSVDAAHIGVTAENGVIALRGDVKTYAERAAAERVALRAYGVKAVANDLVVHLVDGAARGDSEIAQAAVDALKWNSMVPADGVTISVTNGWITLKGAVEWDYQRGAAARAVRNLLGVRGVDNQIAVRPRVNVADLQSKIEAALKRSAEIDARRINISVLDGKVTLRGNVHSWFEREEARRVAWAAPGVKEVDDHVLVVP